jgi:hypothetical protein
VQRHVRHLELERQAPPQAVGDGVLHHLRLGVDGERATGEAPEVEVVALAGELQVDAGVLEPLGVEPGAEPDPAQEADDVVLEHPCPLPLLDVEPAPVFEDDGVDTGLGEEVAEHEAGRPGADDRHLRPDRARLSHQSGRT